MSKRRHGVKAGEGCLQRGPARGLPGRGTHAAMCRRWPGREARAAPGLRQRRAREAEAAPEANAPHGRARCGGCRPGSPHREARARPTAARGLHARRLLFRRTEQRAHSRGAQTERKPPCRVAFQLLPVRPFARRTAARRVPSPDLVLCPARDDVFGPCLNRHVSAAFPGLHVHSRAENF